LRGRIAAYFAAIGSPTRWKNRTRPVIRRTIFAACVSGSLNAAFSSAAIASLSLPDRNELRDRPELVAGQGTSAAVVDSFLILEMLTEHGIEKAVDEILFTEEGFRYFGAWRRYTPNGRWWTEWKAEVAKHERARAGGVE
jgi:hypothetical protein